METPVGERLESFRTQVFTPTHYEVVEGIFRQTTAGFVPDGYDLLTDSFGLLDQAPDRWPCFLQRIEQLNHDALEGEAYKVIWFARHGQGYHNLAELKHGTERWYEHYVRQEGDGEITWGPDALLTELGERQAAACNASWKVQLADGAPLPQSWYSSPLTRAARTLEITWRDIVLDKGVRPTFKEGLRETIGKHPCDRRKTKTYLQHTFPSWSFEVPFAEHDQLWTPDVQETPLQQTLRTQQAMNAIFAVDVEPFISITAHLGAIEAWFHILGFPSFPVKPGQFVPFVVKAIKCVLL